MHLEQYEPQASSSWKGSLMMFVAGTAIGAAGGADDGAGERPRLARVHSQAGPEDGR